jgi:hypothetical protein
MEQQTTGKTHTRMAGLLAALALLLIGCFLTGSIASPIAILVLVPLFLAVAVLLILEIIRDNAGRQLQLRLGKQVYSPGEKITGSVILNLGKEKQARSLTVRFYGLRGRGKRKLRICSTEAEVSGERTYRKGESLFFSLVVPRESRFLGEDAELDGRTFWHVEAQLDIPREVDLIAREPVELTPVPTE